MSARVQPMCSRVGRFDAVVRTVGRSMMVAVIAKHLWVDGLAKVEGKRAQDIVLGARERGMLRFGGNGRHCEFGRVWSDLVNRRTVRNDTEALAQATGRLAYGWLKNLTAYQNGGKHVLGGVANAQRMARAGCFHWSLCHRAAMRCTTRHVTEDE